MSHPAIAERPTSGGIGAFCATCARGTRSFTGRYREFLLDPGTIFTSVAFLFLVAAIIQTPGGLWGRLPGEASTPLYLAAALVGGSYIWWSAFQGVRQKDFTADIPVSFATIGALAIGQHSAGAVV